MVGCCPRESLSLDTFLHPLFPSLLLAFPDLVLSFHTSASPPHSGSFQFHAERDATGLSPSLFHRYGMDVEK
jgi:hypothetical protein